MSMGLASFQRRLEAEYEWAVIGGVIMVACCGLGAHWYAMGVLFDPLVRAFGWTRGPYSVATSIFVVSSTLASWPVGALVDRWGPRRIMAASAVLGGLAWGLISRLGQLGPGDPLVHLYVLYTLVGVAGAGLGDVPIGVLVVRWFRRRRGLAMGLAVLGYGLPGFILVPLSAPLLAAHGWRVVAAGLAGLTAFGCLPFILLVLRDRPADQAEAGMAVRPGRPAPGVVAGVALGMAAFWLIGGSALLAQFSSVAVQMQAIPFLMDRGLTRQLASSIWGALALAGTVGKVSLGWAADRFSPRAITLISILSLAVALAVALIWTGIAGAWLFALLFGLGLGGLITARPLLVEEHFGQRAFGTISGLVTLLTLPGIAASSILAGFLYDRTGSYTLCYSLFVGALLLAAAILLPLRKGGEGGHAR